MSVDKCVPDVRFKGFSGEWQEKELGEIGFFKNGMNFDKAAMGHGHPFVNLQDVFGKNEVSNKNLGLAFSTENQRKEYSLNEGDVLFIRSSVKPEGVGEAAVIPKTLENTTYSGFIIRFRPSVEMDVNFNRFVYSTANCRKQILASSTSSANSNINQESLQGIQLSLPCKSEQTQIGNYFLKLDNLINQHQQKHDKLCSIKKAMLEKMFPKQGETVPEIRFKGFGGEWEESNLEKCTDLLTGNPFNSKEFSSEGIFLVRGMNVKRGYLDSSPEISEFWPSPKGLERYMLEPEDIVVQMDGALIGKSYAKIKSSNLPAILVQRVTRIRCSQVNPEFIYQYIQKDFLNHISGIKTETAVPHLSLHDIRAFSVFLPERLEQNAIGNYFQKLDTLINQHQQQITKLNNIKQACLSKMFV